MYISRKNPKHWPYSRFPVRLVLLGRVLSPPAGNEYEVSITLLLTLKTAEHTRKYRKSQMSCTWNSCSCLLDRYWLAVFNFCSFLIFSITLRFWQLYVSSTPPEGSKEPTAAKAHKQASAPSRKREMETCGCHVSHTPAVWLAAVSWQIRIYRDVYFLSLALQLALSVDECGAMLRRGEPW